MSTTMQAALHLRQHYNESFGFLQEHQFQIAQDVVRRHAEVDLGTGLRDSECFHDWMGIHSMDEIHVIK